MRLAIAVAFLGLASGNAFGDEKLKAGTPYRFQGAGASRTFKEADEWTEIMPVDLKMKPEDASGLMIDDAGVTALLVPVGVATFRAGEPIKGDAGIAITLAIFSTADDKKREYIKWDNAKLSDNKGNKYDQIFYRRQLPLSNIKDKKTRIDSKPATDVLIFERPVAASTEFYLELPGENIGVDKTFKFKFTKKSIAGAEALKK
ncbi:hypothetical protein [Frigoriglobus tundricola]|uniref:Uncharacterized protein n=1 Tax=Frigoriglobus tundricola TaxID=2774151 RepID=A0A6M5YL51_9BACT|nr:hypothetical protein [Frigoriglobus tundricola]QJW94747.1 hypothetical protein FTUN_2269 [Frigoriglobus tundricola]